MVAALLLCTIGCRNRAYNDLYLESLSSEIRDLEDQLYEYDHEYELLERELASLRRENARLKAQQSTSDGDELQFSPRNSDADDFGPIDADDAPGNSILEDSIDGTTDPPASSEPANNPNSTDTLPAPGNEFDIENLSPPTIETGDPMPPPLPIITGQDGGTPDPNSNLELNLSRIEVPALLAGASSSRASIKPAKEKLTDRRVTEISFHPTLTRTLNMDDDSKDDGLFLVLQPLNQRGQMVPVAADLSIVVLDPARDGAQARIGRWDYSATQVKSKLEPIGENQGIHLTLPWNGPDPTADRVLVFVRYTFEDGRQVIGQKEVFVSPSSGVTTVWAPRGSSPSEAAKPNKVVTASGSRVIRPQPSSSGSSDAPAPPTSPSGWRW